MAYEGSGGVAEEAIQDEGGVAMLIAFVTAVLSCVGAFVTYDITGDKGSSLTVFVFILLMGTILGIIRIYRGRK